MMTGGLDTRLYPGHQSDHMTRGLDTRQDNRLDNRLDHRLEHRLDHRLENRLYSGQESAHYSELDNSGRYRSYKDSSGDQGDVDSCEEYHIPLAHSYHHNPH